MHGNTVSLIGLGLLGGSLGKAMLQGGLAKRVLGLGNSESPTGSSEGRRQPMKALRGLRGSIASDIDPADYRCFLKGSSSF